MGEVQKSQQTKSNVDASCEEIQKLAYEIFLQRGGGDGRDVEDWLQAEQTLRAKKSKS
jgi:hypothetical protein